MNSTLQIRIDQKEKQKVKRVLDKIGLDFSSAVKLYFLQIVRYKGIPFPLLTENGLTPKQETRILADSEETIRLHTAGKLKTYRSAREMLENL